ncbi:MAG: protein-disulfide reductase DsbD [Gammaproteobacteria bacterium]|nr:protein-disulfide reductase DsbD [Gammaproteobacteria bacterium]
MKNTAELKAAILRGSLIALILFLMSSTALSTRQPEILKPEQAFTYQISTTQDEIIVDWRIEPEHYLYKSRMSFVPATPGLTLGESRLPKGKPYTDEFFGEMEIYRGELQVRIPIITRPASENITLGIRSQGCADIGLCYPPQLWSAVVNLPPKATKTPSSKLSRMLGPGKTSRNPSDPLPPEEAFQALVTVADPFTVRLDWTIADGYYLYRDSLKVTGRSNVAITSQPIIPPGVWQYDEHFGDTQVFYESMAMTVPLNRSSPQPDVMPLTVEYQGCKKDSICYPPETIQLQIEIPLASAGDQPRQLSSTTPMISEQDRLSQLILNGNLFVVLITFTGLGLLLAFTPCVLPMVPILSGIIAGQGKDITTGRAFALSLTYVLGMAITYTAAGAAFAAMGGQLQALLQKPAVIISVAILFGLMALAMFGWYAVQIPAVLQTRLTAISSRQRAGTFFGTAVMGMLSALIVTTCVAPPLVAAGTVIAQAGDVTRGALSLFFMSIGMGIPLLVIGTSAGKLLPKAGTWMNAVKNLFGIMLLGLAIWMLERLLPATITMLLWATLALLTSIMLGGWKRGRAGINTRLSKLAGLICMVYSALLFISAFSGYTNPMRPLAFLDEPVTQMNFQRIKSVADLERVLQVAKANNQTTMLDFYADWCVSCKEMEYYTFVDAAVQAQLSNTVLLQADVTANDPQDQALLKYFGIFGPPTIMFFNLQGEERIEYRVVGFMTAEEFAAHVTQALSTIDNEALQP